MRASHLSGQMQNGLSPSPYTNRKSKSKRRKSFYSCSCFSFVDMSTPLTRYVLALLELDILPLRVNSIWDKSLVCVANISSWRHIELRQQHIENPVRDLSRCVFSVKDNTLTRAVLFINRLICLRDRVLSIFILSEDIFPARARMLAWNNGSALQ